MNRLADISIDERLASEIFASVQMRVIFLRDEAYTWWRNSVATTRTAYRLLSIKAFPNGARSASLANVFRALGSREHLAEDATLSRAKHAGVTHGRDSLAVQTFARLLAAGARYSRRESNIRRKGWPVCVIHWHQLCFSALIHPPGSRRPRRMKRFATWESCSRQSTSHKPRKCPRTLEHTKIEGHPLTSKVITQCNLIVAVYMTMPDGKLLRFARSSSVDADKMITMAYSATRSKRVEVACESNSISNRRLRATAQRVICFAHLPAAV